MHSKDRVFTQQEHEEISLSLLIKFRDYHQKKIEDGELDGNCICGRQAGMIDELIWCFFDSKRESSGIPHPSSLMTIDSLIHFIETEALPSMASIRPDVLTMDWTGSWKITEDNTYEDEP